MSETEILGKARHCDVLSVVSTLHRSGVDATDFSYIHFCLCVVLSPLCVKAVAFLSEYFASRSRRSWGNIYCDFSALCQKRNGFRHPHSSFAFCLNCTIFSMNALPYFCSLYVPTPDTSQNSCLLHGFFAAISRNVASEKTIYAAIPS